MHCRGSPSPLREAILIFDWFDLVIRLQKEYELKAQHKNSVKVY